MIEAILFDMDGVLVDSEMYYMIGIHEWMTEAGYEGTLESLFILIGQSAEKTYETLRGLLQQRYSVEEIEQMNQRYFDKNPLNYRTILKNSVREVLMEAKSLGLKVGLCSSSPLVAIQAMIRDCHLGAYFDIVVSGEQFNESKPNPEIYLYAAQNIGVEPNNCLVVEDSAIGIEAGCRAGMNVLALKDERFSLNQEKALKQMDDLKEIFEWIELAE